MKKNIKKNIFLLLSVSIVISIILATTAFNANAGLATGKSKFVGNIIAGNVQSNFGTYWNQVTPENATKWGAVEGTKNSMNWSQSDMIYKYAKSNNMPFKFHTLVWGSQEPSWVKNLSASEQKSELLDWMKAASAKYKDSEFVDVVNEPLHAKPSYRNAIGGDGSTGWDWVIWSFEQARTLFPNSKLLINEYGIISDMNATNNYLTIINHLKSRGLVDGIGIQCHHFNMNNVSTSTMKSILDKLGATGLPIYVSELDMTGDDSTQLSRYKEKFPVLYEHSSVKGVTIWGYIQNQTWQSGTELITSSGQERPAMTWLKQYLGNIPGNTSVTTAVKTTSPTQTSSTIKYGDVNGDGKITSTDSSIVGRHILGSVTLTGDYLKAADVSGDGKISSSDVSLIERNVLGVINTFPAG